MRYIVLTVCLLAATAVAQPDTLIINGSFESGVLDPWYGDGWAIDSGYPYDGDYCAFTVGENWLRQDFEPISKWRLAARMGFWMRQPGSQWAEYDLMFEDGDSQRFEARLYSEDWSPVGVDGRTEPRRKVTGLRVWGGAGDDSTFVDAFGSWQLLDIEVRTAAGPTDTMLVTDSVACGARVYNYGPDAFSGWFWLRFEHLRSLTMWYDSIWIEDLGAGVSIDLEFGFWSPESLGEHMWFISINPDGGFGIDFWVVDPPGVHEQTPSELNPWACPTVLRAPDLARIDGRVMDIRGCDVTDERRNLSPGIYFLKPRGSAAPRKVVVTR